MPPGRTSMEQCSSLAPAVCPHPPMVTAVTPGCDGGYRAYGPRQGCRVCFRCPVLPRISGGAGAWGRGRGWSCGGAWVGVLFSKSPRGRPARSWEPEAANPLNFKTGSGRRFVRSGFGWGGSDGLWVAETLICKVFRTRVSLKSCSGAILDCNGCGGAGCVCCLRTQ